MIIDVLIDNCFPLSFIFYTINKRIKQIAYNNNEFIKEDNGKKQLTKKDYFTIPYVNSISESFLPVCAKFGFHMSYCSQNTLKKYIKRGKDNLKAFCQQDVVYKISCNDCEATYIGQTKRKLGTRIQEHIKDINKKSGTLSVISNHRVENNHVINWDEVEIVDKERSYTKRIISEMIYIKKQTKGLNKQSDTDLLPDVYVPLIESFAHN